MKRIAIIDQLSNIEQFRKFKYENATAEEILKATGGNTGNVAFVYAIQKILGDNQRVIGWHWRPERVKKNFDHIVICAANQLGAHADLGSKAEKLLEFGLPVTIIGLGAQSDSLNEKPVIPEGTQKFLSVVASLSNCDSNISVRGKYTKNILAEYGISATATGCPSLMISPDINLGQTIFQQDKKLLKIAVSAGNIVRKKSAWIEPYLCEIVDLYNGAYVLQHPTLMMKFGTGEISSLDEEKMNSLLGLYGKRFTRSTFINWMRLHAAIFVDVPNWMRFLKNYDGVVGPRYHGVALGIQAGIPGLVIAIDSRTEELSLETGIKYIKASKLQDMSNDEVIKYLNWSESDASFFDNNRQNKISMFIEFIKSNGLEPSIHLDRLQSKISLSNQREQKG